MVMGPPIGVVLVFALWLVIVVMAIAMGRRPGVARRLLFLTAALPVLALVTIPFDDFAVRRWFPQGTPPWFVGYEILIWIPVWVVLASAILLWRRPTAAYDWIWAGAMACVVSAAAALLWIGIIL